MNIVFVTPPVSRKERYGTLAPAGSYAPPLGLCSLAAVVREKGHTVSIVDAPVAGLDHEGTLRRLRALEPQVIGITSTTSTFDSARRLAGTIKEAGVPATVIAGGVHVSALPDQSLAEAAGLDAVVVGEAEETILELLSALESDRDLGTVNGIGYRTGNGVALTPPRALMKDLDRLPLPAWDLLEGFPAAYNVQAQSIAHSPSTSVCTSRGCTGRCTFCDRRIFGSNLRAHSAAYVIRMVRELYERYGVRDIQFEDDNFMLFRKRLFEFCAWVKEAKLDLTWSCQARVDMVQPETLKIMKEAGCWMILYGVESGSQKVLDAMSKGITLEKIERAVTLTHQAGIGCKGFFIAGFLNEDQESLAQTYAFVRRSKLNDISFHYYTPFPGSEAHAQAPMCGVVRGSYADMTYYRPVFVPHGLTEEDLIRHTKACYRAFYSRPRVILDYIQRIRHPAELVHYGRAAAALATYLLFRKE